MTYIFDTFETLLKLALSEGEFADKLRAEVEATFSGEHVTQVSDEKEAYIFKRLEQSLIGETVGQLIKSAITQKQIDILTLSAESKLTPETLTELLEDRVLVDRIPLKAIKRLMNRLTISMELFEKAIWVTFNQFSIKRDAPLSVECLQRKSSGDLSPVFDQRSLSTSNLNIQNQKNMLEEYIMRLKEIY